MGVDTEKGKYTKPEGSKVWEYLICFNCTIMAMVAGFVQGWNSPGTMAFMEPDSPIPITASDAATLVALISVGFMVSTPVSMYAVDKVGRKKIILISALPMIVSWALITIAMNVWLLYVSRFLSGISIGMFVNLLSIYIGEVISPCLRGAALTVNIVFMNIGILVAYVIVPCMSITASSLIFMSATIVFFIMFSFMPESPYYLGMKNRLEETEAVLEKLRGKTDVSDEVELVLETVRSNNRQRTQCGLKELLSVRANRRAFLINNFVVCSMQFGGFYTMISFVQLIFKPLTNILSDHMIVIVLGVLQLIFVLITTTVVDRLGRKPLLLISGVLVVTANLVIAAFFYVNDFLHMDLSAYSLVPFIATIVLMCANNCGTVGLHLTVQSEIFATEIKAFATCLGGIISAIFHIIASKTFILMTVTWGYGPTPAFLSYAVIVAICTVVILRSMPEMKGKTFVQIQKELND